MSKPSFPTIKPILRSDKPKQKKCPKFRFLLDSAFAKPSVFKRLGKKAVVKHVRHDFDLPRQAEDIEIYNLAVKKNLFVVTMNLKHFKKLVRKDHPGVLSLDSGLSNEEMDQTLSKFVSGKNPLDFYGKAVKLK